MESTRISQEEQHTVTTNREIALSLGTIFGAIDTIKKIAEIALPIFGIGLTAYYGYSSLQCNFDFSMLNVTVIDYKKLGLALLFGISSILFSTLSVIESIKDSYEVK